MRDTTPVSRIQRDRLIFRGELRNFSNPHPLSIEYERNPNRSSIVKPTRRTKPISCLSMRPATRRKRQPLECAASAVQDVPRRKTTNDREEKIFQNLRTPRNERTTRGTVEDNRPHEEANTRLRNSYNSTLITSPPKTTPTPRKLSRATFTVQSMPKVD